MMPVKKFIVKKELHVRSSNKVVDENIMGVLKPGFVIDAVSESYGDSYKGGTDVWIKDGNGFHYWKGGVEEIQFTSAPHVPSYQHKYDYYSLFDLPGGIKTNEGEGVVVAILDSGCYKHRAFKDRIIGGYNAITDSVSNFSDNSYISHGTRVAGIIASNGEGSKMKGLAPRCELIIIKVSEGTEFSAAALLKGLSWLEQASVQGLKKPNIINLSLRLRSSSSNSAINEKIQRLKDQGAHIIAAGQNDRQLYDSNTFYPASHPLVVSVGAMKPASVDHNQSAAPINSSIDFIVPNKNILSTADSDEENSDSGSSYATAFLSGAAALAASHLKVSPALNLNPIEFLRNGLPNFDKTLFNNEFKIYKNEQ